MALKYIGNHLPFLRIGGRSAYPLPILVRCQTDASYRPPPVDSARAAALLYHHTGARIERIEQIHSATGPTEAEWSSIYLGLQTAMENGYTVVGIENDNLSVVSQLTLHEGHLRKPYARHYKSKILSLARHTAWTGVRWIPREDNLADLILRRGV